MKLYVVGTLDKLTGAAFFFGGGEGRGEQFMLNLTEIFRSSWSGISSMCCIHTQKHTTALHVLQLHIGVAENIRYGF